MGKNKILAIGLSAIIGTQAFTINAETMDNTDISANNAGGGLFRI